MADYVLRLSDTQVLEISNEGEQTSVRNEIRSAGAHQVSQTTTTTGELVSPPQYVSVGEGIILVLMTASGEHHVRVAGGNVSTGHFDIDREQLQGLPGSESEAKPSVEEDATDRVCLSCGETVEERFRFCPLCGKRL